MSFVLTLTSTDGIGVTYLADPVCDDVRATLPLEVHIITFASNYYMTSQGTLAPSFAIVVSLMTSLIQVARN